MTPLKLVLRSLHYYRRTHFGVVLGVMVSTAVLVGALAVGDSVRHTLRLLALAWLGRVEVALASQDRFFRARLADDLQNEVPSTVAPVLLLRGTAVVNGGEARANHVQILGVEDRFWKLGGARRMSAAVTRDAAAVNERLAEQLRLKKGDDLLLRVEKPSLLPRDAPLSTLKDLSASLRLTVAEVADDAHFGRFSLQANQVPPYNAFVPLSLLQEATDLKGRANVLLVGRSLARTPTVGEADAALRRCYQLTDVGLELRELGLQNVAELRSKRVFLEPAVARVAFQVTPEARGVLTYFANRLQVGSRSTPYSMVAAMQAPPVPTGMNNTEIVINKWLAQDLQTKPGDMLTLSYFVLGPMRQLMQRSATFKIRAVVPLEGPTADRELMPDFPGLSGVENCRDWEPGVNVDLAKIRDKDEVYWARYRGTPKAFVTLSAGQRLWGNRFGDLTAIRYPRGLAAEDAIEQKLRSALDPSSLGLYCQPVREQAMAASTQSQDFGQLFLGFSFFLLASAVLLTGLLFTFGAEQRSEEVGTLLAVGFTPRRIRRLLLQEATVLSLSGSMLGACLGAFFTRAVLLGLGSVWHGAVRTSSFRFLAEPGTLISGFAASVVIALLAIGIVVRKQGKASPRELLTGGAESVHHFTVLPCGRREAGYWVAALSTLMTLACLLLTCKDNQGQAAGLFFGAGALLLMAGLGLCHALLSGVARSRAHHQLSTLGLSWRNCARRRGRSLAIIGLLAFATFLIVAVGANRHDPGEGAERRSSATGGFSLIGESTLPVYDDLNNADEKGELGLQPELARALRFVQLRVHEGDDASCLNLNRAQAPRLLGVRPEDFQSRRAFTFARVLEASLKAEPWLLLNSKPKDGAVPAVGDQATVAWGLGRSLGSVLLYKDEQGRDFRVRIVGLLSKSILQGSLLISEQNFTRRFPSESGYRLFLIDAPPDKASRICEDLSTAMEDAGLELTPTARRLAELNTVENTYLSIFQALGGLGLLLGSLGLGVVVLRNVLERRSELALLRAVGFKQRSVQRLVFGEHMILMLLGLGCGLLAAAVAVLPALRSPGGQVPYTSLAVTLAAVTANGALWIWLATARSLRGPLIESLRNE